jgi:hypothetical protein
MIRHLRHSEIDKAAWDRMLLQCPGRLWYARSAVLDRTGPWDALIDEEAGALMPLPYRVKWGVHYVYNPYGLQQLGVFAAEPAQRLTDAFLQAIPGQFRYIDGWLNTESTPSAALPGGRIPQVNQVLRCEAELSTLRAAYAKGHQRNLRKHPDLVVHDGLGADAFIDLFERTTGARFGGSPPGSLEPLRAIIADALAEGTGRILSITGNGQPIAAACFITWEGRSILLKSANDEQGQAVQAMFHLTDHWIAQHAGSGTLLDFAGSNTPSVARFNAGFGATATTYIRYRWNRLPWPFRYLRP